MRGMIKFHKRPRLKDPVLLAAWPGMGNIALKATLFLRDKLKAEEFAEVISKDFFYPTEAWIEEGRILSPKFPQGKFYFYRNKKGKNDLIIFLSDAQPIADVGYFYAQKVLGAAQEFNVKRVYSFASMPVPIEHTQKPAVWVTASSKQILKEFERFNVTLMSSGQISGLNGLILSVAKEKGIEAVCLLGEMPLYTIQIENPKSSLAVLDVFTKALDIVIDTKELSEQALFIEQEIDKLLEFLKVGTDKNDAISEEEIEKIKKSLAIYTKLPESAKKNIETLFEESKKDISKASELKKELDKWNIYNEYEDRFLDLFKKHEKRNNQ